jgi:hypothetical protein
MNEIKNDYNYDQEINRIRAKTEARQALGKAVHYRSDCIDVMNEIIALKKITHLTDIKKIKEFEKLMTILNRKTFVFRKLLVELKAARKKLVKL